MTNPDSQTARDDVHPRHALVVIVLLALVAAAMVASTWSVFSQTLDEPAHIAAGMEWVDEGSYSTDPQHPPLARLLFAIGPRLAGASFQEEGGGFVSQGNAVLYCCGDYVRILSLARAGNLPFLLLGIFVVALWSWRLFGPRGAVIGTLLYASLPPVLAHSGVATTDMAAASTIVAALLAFDLWMERRTPLRSVLLGAAGAAALLAKLSAVAFVPLGFAGLLIARALGKRDAFPATKPPSMRMLPSIAVIAAAGFLVIWAVFRFSVGPLFLPEKRDWYDRVFPEWALESVHAVGDSVPIPAPELARGVLELLAHSEDGHFSYLRGEVGTEGWWEYFPIAIGLKTPIPFLLLSITGVILLLIGARSHPRRLAPLLAAAAILGLAMTSSINIGIRHILPVYPLLALVAAHAALWLWSRHTAGRLAVALLIAWQIFGVARAHPDHLPWFNFMAGDHPERWLLDSNLDWGQDLLRLEAVAKERGMEVLTLSYFGTADLAKHDLPALQPLHDVPTQGWVAVSLMNRMGPGFGRAEPAFAWLDAHPAERVGRSILLYHVRPPDRFLLPVLLGPEPLVDPRGTRLITRVLVRSSHDVPVEVLLGERTVEIQPDESRPDELRTNQLSGAVLSASAAILDGLEIEIELVDQAGGRAIPMPVLRGSALGRGTLTLRTSAGERERSLRIQDLQPDGSSEVRYRLLEGTRVIEERTLPFGRVEAGGPAFVAIDLPRTAREQTIEIEPLDPDAQIWAMVVETDPASGAIDLRFP
ncbi:MAG: hypothetical protein LC732_06725 [Acidobacteria bacterium]|nr:hypothetical protein [Acidobacteriota bacterium]